MNWSTIKLKKISDEHSRNIHISEQGYYNRGIQKNLKKTN